MSRVVRMTRPEVAEREAYEAEMKAKHGDKWDWCACLGSRAPEVTDLCPCALNALRLKLDPEPQRESSTWTFEIHCPPEPPHER